MAWAPGGGGGARGSRWGVHRRDCQVCALVLVVLVGGLGSAEGKCDAIGGPSWFRCSRNAQAGDSKCDSKCGGSWPFGAFHICCTADCCPPPDPPGPPPPPPPRGDCPPFKDGIFPATPGVDTCATIDVALAVLQRDAQDDVTWTMWEQGLRMFQQRINRRGGIRIGQGKVGWLNLTIAVLGDVGVAGLVENYVGLCKDSYTDVLITPYDSSQALQVVQRLNKDSVCQLPVLSASGADAVFDVGYPNLWSVLRRTSEWVGEVGTYLARGAPQGLGATSVAIVYQNDTLHGDGDHGGITQVLLNRLEKLGLKLHTATHACGMTAADATSVLVEDVHECTKRVSEFKADVLVGVGGSTTFQVMAQDLHDACDTYAPKAAFFIAGGERNVNTKADTAKWMGTVMWSKTMPHTGPQGLPTDPYVNRSNIPKGVDIEFERYMGSPPDFAKAARSRLSTDEITHIHAKAAATLLLLQLALEQAPEDLNTGGYGMAIPTVEFSKNNLNFRDPTFVAQLRQSMTSLNISTFWGQMRMDEKGSNKGFNIAVGQVQSDGSEKLVVPSQAEYPAEWPCDNDTRQDDSSLKYMIVGIAVGVVLTCCVGYYVTRKIRRRRPKASLLAKLLTEQEMPDIELAQRDVDARWQTAARMQAMCSGGGGSARIAPQATSSRRQMRDSLSDSPTLRSTQAATQVMFR
eukprot:SAG25_NODE_26_length_21086_cov_21.643065_9_plen_688_part_00